MKDRAEDRWYRWDKLLNKGEYQEVVRQFDFMLENGKQVLIGDLVRRDHALKEMNVISISPMALHERKNKNGRK